MPSRNIDENMHKDIYRKLERNKYVAASLVLFGAASLFYACGRQKDSEPVNIKITINNYGTININLPGWFAKLNNDGKVIMKAPEQTNTEKRELEPKKIEKKDPAPKKIEKQKSVPVRTEKEKPAPVMMKKERPAPKVTYSEKKVASSDDRPGPYCEPMQYRKQRPIEYGRNYQTSLSVIEYIINNSPINDYKDSWVQSKDWTVRSIGDHVKIYKSNHENGFVGKDVFVKISAPRGIIPINTKIFVTRHLIPGVNDFIRKDRERRVSNMMERMTERNNPFYSEMMKFGDMEYEFIYNGDEWIIGFSSYELNSYYEENAHTQDIFRYRIRNRRVRLEARNDLNLAP